MNSKLLSLLTMAFSVSLVRCGCLHNGCPMSDGLLASEVDGVIRSSLRNNEFPDNVIKTVTWNVRRTLEDDQWIDGKKDVCRFLNYMDSTILGLQDVDVSQVQYVRSCLKKYKVIGRPPNVLVFKNLPRLKVLNSGQFISGRAQQPSQCTWMKVQFGERLNGNRFQILDSLDKNGYLANKLSRILQFLIPQKSSSAFYRAFQRRIRYRWRNLFVASVKINGHTDKETKEEFNAVLKELKNKVMDRRRYPLIVLVDLGQEDNSLAYQVLLLIRNWLTNTMEESSKKFPMMSYVNENDPSSDKLSDFILQSRFSSAVAGVISDYTATREGVSFHRPVFATLTRKDRHPQNKRNV